MNIYETEFVCKCPVNGVCIKYVWRVQKGTKIMVESINEIISKLIEGLHEDIADKLYEKFGGLQMLVASHDGVRITTLRG